MGWWRREGSGPGKGGVEPTGKGVLSVYMYIYICVYTYIYIYTHTNKINKQTNTRATPPTLQHANSHDGLSPSLTDSRL